MAQPLAVEGAIQFADRPLGRAESDFLTPSTSVSVFTRTQRSTLPSSHWQIPDLHGNEGNVERWARVKSETLVLGVKKSLTARPNGRSANWIAPSTANGCAMACAYCYVPRQKGYANPITVFTNIEQITGYLRRHVARQGPKAEPDQCDPAAWVYDLCENSDCSVATRSATL